MVTTPVRSYGVLAQHKHCAAQPWPQLLSCLQRPWRPQYVPRFTLRPARTFSPESAIKGPFPLPLPPSMWPPYAVHHVSYSANGQCLPSRNAVSQYKYGAVSRWWRVIPLTGAVAAGQQQVTIGRFCTPAACSFTAVHTCKG